MTTWPSSSRRVPRCSGEARGVVLDGRGVVGLRDERAAAPEGLGAVVGDLEAARAGRARRASSASARQKSGVVRGFILAHAGAGRRPLERERQGQPGAPVGCRSAGWCTARTCGCSSHVPCASAMPWMPKLRHLLRHTPV